jgi:DNA-binding YbaB/EbfC family protein
MSKGKRPRGSAQDMMAHMQRLQEELSRAQAELAEETVEATAGGGAVRVVMSGTQECKAVFIEPDLLQDGDKEMLQDLILLAVNQALHDSQALAARRLGPLTGGFGGTGFSG